MLTSTSGQPVVGFELTASRIIDQSALTKPTLVPGRTTIAIQTLISIIIIIIIIIINKTYLSPYIIRKEMALRLQ